MILEIVICAYLSAVSAYALVFSVAGTSYRSRTSFKKAKKQNKFAVLIPAYKEDAVIVSVAKEALKQRYPAACYDVVVIADSLQPRTLESLAELPIKLIKVYFEKSTKVKALRAALDQLEGHYDIALILDADNVMEENFLNKINLEYSAGSKVIQARRTAKNLNTSFAILDAFSEIVNNHIYRKGSQALGLSSPLIGSGMAFPYALLKETLHHMHAVGGFDRELQVKMVEQGNKIKYLDEAVVLDEKVTKPEVFSNQRRRWLSSQFIYIRKFFKKGILALLKGNLDLFNITLLNNMQLPRIINLGILFLLVVSSTVFAGYFSIPNYYWLILLGINLSAIGIAVPAKFYNKRFFMALLSVPKAFLIICRSLSKIRGANKEFIHTPHTT